MNAVALYTAVAVVVASTVPQHRLPQTQKWWLRPELPTMSGKRHRNTNEMNEWNEKNGTSYATAWQQLSDVQWAAMSAGDTLCISGAGFGGFSLPVGLANLIIDGGCINNDGATAAGTTQIPRGLLVGGTPIPFQSDGSTGWHEVDNTGIYRTVIAATPQIFAAEVVLSNTVEEVGAGVVVLPTGLPAGVPGLTVRRLYQAPINCTTDGTSTNLRPAAWRQGQFCNAPPLSNGSHALYYMPGPAIAGTSSVISFQLHSTTVVGLYNTTILTFQNFEVVGPAERLIDVAGGSNVVLANNSLKWGSFAAIGYNYKSETGMGVQGGKVLRNTITASGSG